MHGNDVDEPIDPDVTQYLSTRATLDPQTGEYQRLSTIKWSRSSLSVSDSAEQRLRQSCRPRRESDQSRCCRNSTSGGTSAPRARSALIPDKPGGETPSPYERGGRPHLRRVRLLHQVRRVFSLSPQTSQSVGYRTACRASVERHMAQDDCGISGFVRDTPTQDVAVPAVVPRRR